MMGAWIVPFLEEYFDEVEADFLRYYGLDLREALWGEDWIGVRRICALVEGLPSDSALGRKGDPPGGRWSTTDELLAVLIEVVDVGNRMFLKAHTAPGTDVGNPIHIPRPWEEDRPTRSFDPKDMQEFFAPSEVKFVGGD